MKTSPVWRLCWGLVLFSCHTPPIPADAAVLAREQLQKAGVKDVSLTLTDSPDQDDQLLFQVEGKRDGKPVMGAIEVDYQPSTPDVKINLFDVNPEAPTK